MAQYTSVAKIEGEFGDRFSFGTYGTCIMTTSQGTRIIEKVSSYIDFELQNIYGTVSPLFGTNSYGTGNVPTVISDIATDLCICRIMKNTLLSIAPEQLEWSKEYCTEGNKFLQQLMDGEKMALPFSGTIDTGNLPHLAGEYGTVLGEVITLDGTNLHALDYPTAVKYGFMVYGTAIDGTTVYVEPTNYIAYYYGNSLTGTNYGQIHGVGSGTICVRVDYYYKQGRIFGLNDSEMWGESSKEDRGG